MQYRAFIQSWLLTALGILLASFIFPGIAYRDASALLFAVLLLSLCSTFVKPLLMLVAMPLIILSLGFGIWFINAFLFLGVAELVDGFHVDGFGNALAGSFVISLTSLLAKVWLGTSGMNIRVQSPQKTPQSRRPTASKDLDDDDVIDV
ncbi:MAG: phage holin family protein [Verrucomicrobia bacterium]|nr:phage holin family protein [Verrucomicrobiota bacterium]